MFKVPDRFGHIWAGLGSVAAPETSGPAEHGRVLDAQVGNGWGAMRTVGCGRRGGEGSGVGARAPHPTAAHWMGDGVFQPPRRPAGEGSGSERAPGRRLRARSPTAPARARSSAGCASGVAKRHPLVDSARGGQLGGHTRGAQSGGTLSAHTRGTTEGLHVGAAGGGQLGGHTRGAHSGDTLGGHTLFGQLGGHTRQWAVSSPAGGQLGGSTRRQEVGRGARAPRLGCKAPAASPEAPNLPVWVCAPRCRLSGAEGPGQRAQTARSRLRSPALHVWPGRCAWISPKAKCRPSDTRGQPACAGGGFVTSSCAWGAYSSLADLVCAAVFVEIVSASKRWRGSPRGGPFGEAMAASAGAGASGNGGVPELSMPGAIEMDFGVQEAIAVLEGDQQVERRMRPIRVLGLFCSGGG